MFGSIINFAYLLHCNQQSIYLTQYRFASLRVYKKREVFHLSFLFSFLAQIFLGRTDSTDFTDFFLAKTMRMILCG